MDLYCLFVWQKFGLVEYYYQGFKQTDVYGRALNYALESECVTASWCSIQVGGNARERKQGLPVEKLHGVTLNSAIEPLSVQRLCSLMQAIAIGFVDL